MDISQKAWELENAVKLVDPARDALYSYDKGDHAAITKEKPWEKDVHLYKKIRISAVALLKMVMHARSGGSIEVMGLMQGKVLGDTFIVTDAFRLPVEGTETRVNASESANEYMVQYLQSSRDNGREENVVGWYHSHPGYGCWLSGIDVDTEIIQQSYSEPFVAVVIDPDRTISAGKVEIGAFRTYPKDHQPTNTSEGDGYQTIPLAKMEDFGAHANRYYSLEISHFKSTLDTHLLESLWNKYWVSTLSQSPLFTNRDYSSKQMLDLSGKIRQAEVAVKAGSRGGPHRAVTGGRSTAVDKAVRDSNKIAREELIGLLASEVKGQLFNGIGAAATNENSIP